MIALHLVNMGGYRFILNHFEQRAETKLLSRLDRSDYEESQLIEVKVPISLPYQVDWKDFERYDGEIELNGVHYNYVKRKVHNDSLVLLCIPNTDKMKIYNAREEFFSLVNNLQQNNDGKVPPSKPSAIKSITSDCNKLPDDVVFTAPSGPEDIKGCFNEYLAVSNFLPSPEKPPEILA